MPLAVWTCTGFEGHFPVGTAAVVVAPNAETAAQMLSKEVCKIARQTVTADQMKLVNPYQPQVIILNDGDY